MINPPNPPPNPDEHLMRERARRQEAERGARSRRPGKAWRGLSAGDKIIFLALTAAFLGVMWLFFSWLLAP